MNLQEMLVMQNESLVCDSLVSRLSSDEQLKERIARRVHVVASECWEWTGTKNEGDYGRIVIAWKRNGQPVRRFAHRIAYQLVKGVIPADLDIDHLCRNHSCVNPDHLEAVSRQENVRRGRVPQMMKEKAAQKTHCKYGHLYRSDNKVFTNRKTGAQTCKTCVTARRREVYYADPEKFRERSRRYYYNKKGAQL